MFDAEQHLKWTSVGDKKSTKRNAKGEMIEKSKSKQTKKSETNLGTEEKIKNKQSKIIENSGIFKRRIKNPDMSTCWLNSCLQLLLSGFDHSQLEFHFRSELGTELLALINTNQNESINPTTIKNILIFAEDMRIASRKSELTSGIDDGKKQAKMLEYVDRVYLNFRTGQQCVRDFFICLKENMDN